MISPSFQLYFHYIGFQVASLLSDIGGAFGFYLGLSIIALFEFLELTYDFIRMSLQKFKNRGHVSNKATK